jgi:methylase of polypeptide subunit release factors
VREEVFAPTIAAKRFLEVLKIDDSEKDKKVLDLGTGTGIFAIYLALKGYKDVLAVDHNKASLECAEMNVELNGVGVEVRESDMLSGIRPEEKFGLIVTNPSNLPEGIWRDPGDRNLMVDQELMGSERGNEVLITLAENIDRVMDKGRVVFLQPVYTNVNKIKQIFISKGFRVEVLSRTVHELSTWPWEEWKYDKDLLIKRLKEFEEQDGEEDYIVEKDREPAIVIEIVEARRD